MNSVEILFLAIACFAVLYRKFRKTLKTFSSHLSLGFHLSPDHRIITVTHFSACYLRLGANADRAKL